MRTALPILIALYHSLSSCHQDPICAKPDQTKLHASANRTVEFADVTKAAYEYVNSSKLEKRFCFLFNVDAASSTNRFMVYNFENDSIMYSGKAAHGRCNRNFLVGRKYSDEPGCGCTAPGKYRIGTRYTGRFGLAYKLHGLDSTNQNALRRSIVLHGHECVPAADARVLEICQSDGCPMVAPYFMKQLDSLLRTTQTPVLLWIYRSLL